MKNENGVSRYVGKDLGNNTQYVDRNVKQNNKINIPEINGPKV